MAVTTVGFAELLILLLTFGGPFNQFLGLPPGDRDQSLVHAAATDSVLYIEWSARGEGEPGAKGVDGLAADPEIKAFVSSIQTAIEKMIEREAGPMGDTLKTLPELIVTLTGQPGCLYAGFDTAAPVAAEGMPPQFAMMMSLRAGLVVNAGDHADAVTDQICSLLTIGMGREIDKLDHVALPSPSPVEVHRHDNYIILGIGPETVEGILERLAAKSGGIADHKVFSEGWKDLKIDRAGLITFLDVENGAKQIGGLLGMEAQITNTLEMAGLAGLKSSMGVTGVADGQIVSRGHIKGVSGDQGLMGLVAGRGIKAADFAAVPADSDVVFAYSADAEKILTALTNFADTMSPSGSDDIAEGMQMFGDLIGLDVEEDIFGVLDHVITISNSPGDGGWIASSPVVTIGLKDPQGAAKSVAKFADQLEQHFAGTFNANQWRRRGLTLERREFMDTEIHMVNTIGDDVPIAPAWCLTETHLLIALHPQALKSRLRRVAADDWKSYGEHFAGGPDGETVAFSAADMQSVLPQLYGFVPWFGQLIYSEMQSEGFATTLLDFPSAAALLPYMTNSKAYVVRTNDGLRRYSEGPPLVGSLPSLIPTMAPTLMLFSVRQQQHMHFEDVQVLEAEAAAEFEVVEEALQAE